jgi:hypothetical protein
MAFADTVEFLSHFSTPAEYNNHHLLQRPDSQRSFEAFPENCQETLYPRLICHLLLMTFQPDILCASDNYFFLC